MKFQWALSLLAAYGGVATASRASANRLSQTLHGYSSKIDARQAHVFEKKSASTATTPRFLNNDTTKFAVDGKTIPDVDFDVGESYAGQLPISNKTNEADNLFFWFFPTANEEHKDKKEITIWFNGGPGCSSLLGLMQENGPLLWQPGSQKPQKNPWSWHLLTNVVWVEQPVGVGFSQGDPSITNEDQLAAQFMGFWRNFVDTFSLHGWKVYIAAESYGGFYGPYISSNMLDAKNTEYFDVGGLLVYDGVMFNDAVQFNVPSLEYVKRHDNLFNLDDGVKTQIKKVSDRCGFTAFNEKYLRFPPAGPAPRLPPGRSLAPNGTIIYDEECENLWGYITNEASEVNPCFSVYNIMDHCPAPFDPLGDATPYLDRADVKKAIHAPESVQWTECVNGNVFNTSDGSDLSTPSGNHQIPHVIEATQNVIIAQGAMDWIITLDGVLLGIQNMTWGGKLGFQQLPSDPFYVPRYGYNPNSNNPFYGSNLPAGSGVLGTTHTERGLTLVVTELAGHEGPEYSAAGAFRHLEKLLGRVKSLSDTEPFTLPELRNITQAKKPLGKGTVKIPHY